MSEQSKQALAQALKAKKERDAQKASMVQPVGYNVADSATYIGASESTVYNLLKAGVIARRKLGRRTIILRAELDAYLQSLPVAA